MTESYERVLTIPIHASNVSCYGYRSYCKHFSLDPHLPEGAHGFCHLFNETVLFISDDGGPKRFHRIEQCLEADSSLKSNPASTPQTDF